MNHVKTYRRVLITLGLLWMTLPLAGCGGYVIEGKAIRGEFSTLSFVNADDSRLSGPGVENVGVYLYRDPGTLGEKLNAEGMTGDQGQLYLPVSGFGAGYLQERWRIHTYRPGMQSVSTMIALPEAKRHMKLLITLGPGVAEMPVRGDELMHQYEHFK